MKLVIGLGNPGEKYEETRHNIGFQVVDQYLKKHHLSMTHQKFRADYTSAHLHGEKVYFLKPFTYMNLSGEAILPFMSYYGIGMEDLLVIYDDMDIEPGRIRLRQSGSAGGHNGVKSVIGLLGSQEFYRLKVGIGRPAGGWKVTDHVLANFTVDEQLTINQAIDQAVEAIDYWIKTDDFLATMNAFNKKK